MKYGKTLELPVPAERAWEALSDVRRWPDWTPTVERVDTGPGPVRVGQALALTFTMSGPLGGVLGALGAAKIRDMVDAEAAVLAKLLAATDDHTSRPALDDQGT